MKDKPRYINAGGKLIDLGTPVVMGILNITPDSFYSGSRYRNDNDLLKAAASMASEGAAIIDIGAYSSRPGASDISEEEEGERLFSALKSIHKELPEMPLSVDTFRSSIARKAVLEFGASMINDISGGEADTRMFAVVSELNVPYVLMHMRGTPFNMSKNTDYDDVVADVIKWFGPKIYKLHSEAVKDIIIDPGFGFAKTTDQNFEMLRRFKEFSVTGLPLMAGLSRKSTIWKTLEITPEEALNGTSVMNTVALMNGADILRVHDVKQAIEAIKLVNRINAEKN